MNYPFIIRSSSIDEDNEEKSNAGKYMSIYNCTSRMDLINYIIKCWNSKNSNESMGVIIQEQLFPYCSGVAFICDDKGERRLFVEGVIGLGELLVSGYVTPSTYLYDYARDEFDLIHKTTQRVAEFPLKDNTIINFRLLLLKSKIDIFLGNATNHNFVSRVIFNFYWRSNCYKMMLFTGLKKQH